MYTIKDVAKEAGVSTGTVSNVLNNSPTVKEKNRIAVLRAIEKLGFVPNMTARTLSTKSSRMLGLIIPSIANPYYPEIARGVEDAAVRLGLSVFLCNCDRNKEKQRNYVEELIKKNVDGIIIAGCMLDSAELREYSERVHIVLIGGKRKHVGAMCSVIEMETRPGIRASLEYLYSNHHRRIAFISGSHSPETDDRVLEYKAFLKEKGIDIYPEYIVLKKYDWKSGYQAGKAFMALDVPPSAIMASNDMMAMGAMKAVQELGKKVPEDISVIGYDNIEMTNLVTPPMTTVNVPKYEAGIQSVELMRQMLSGESVGCYMELHTELVKRGSVESKNK